MELVGSEFTDRVLFTKSVWWPAREIVQRTIEKRYEVREGGREEGGRREGGGREGGRNGGREGGEGVREREGGREGGGRGREGEIEVRGMKGGRERGRLALFVFLYIQRTLSFKTPIYNLMYSEARKLRSQAPTIAAAFLCTVKLQMQPLWGT